MKLEVGSNCWVLDTHFGWLPAQVKKVDYDATRKKYKIELNCDSDHAGDEQLIEIVTSDLNETNEKIPQLRNLDDTVDDLTTLSHLNEPSVLNSVKLRYQKKSIYTFSGVVLIAMNPFERMNQLYNPSIIRKYKNAEKSDNPPHLFSIADESYKALKKTGKSQSIIVSGESGAGKTVSAKYIMRFFASVHTNGTTIDTTEIENQILATNPIMEAFGNAKTIRNDNSSRFGKYLKISFDKNNVICGAKIQTYLLERSRLVYQSAKERNYHIFYQLLSGLPVETRSELGLTGPEEYHYLYQGRTTQIKDVDDKKDFEITCNALETIGLDEKKRFEVFKVLAALLHIGNINIQNSRNEAVLNSEDPHLLLAAQLLGLDKKEFAKWITKKKVSTRSDNIASTLRYHEAIVARDSVSKYIYSLLFDWLVQYINNDLSPLDNFVKEAAFIGVLDIYGFEHFQTNSFEQFCINYANEKLQQEFTHNVFKLQQEEYIKEGIEWSFITYSDNQPCIDLIENNDGIISLLDEQCRLPSGSDKTWAEKMFQSYISPPYNKVFKKTRFGSDKFIVSHYALDVSYEVAGFIEKNRDTVSDAQNEVLNATTNNFLCEILNTTYHVDNLPPMDSKKRSTIRKKSTLGFIFKKSLNELMFTINSTDAHYIRCIKPNEDKKSWLFDSAMVLSQLRACGVLETIRISLVGFPSRYKYDEFLQRFKLLYSLKDMRKIQNIDDLDFDTRKKLCIKLLGNNIENHTLFQAGKTKLFFRSGVLGQLEIAKSNKLSAFSIVIQKNIRGFLVRKMLLEVKQSTIYLQSLLRGQSSRSHLASQLRSVTMIQSVVRGCIARKRVKERIAAVTLLQRQIRGFKARTEYKLVKQIKKEQQEKFLFEKQAKERREAEAAAGVILLEEEKLAREANDARLAVETEELRHVEKFNVETDNEGVINNVIIDRSFSSTSTILYDHVKETEKNKDSWNKLKLFLPPDFVGEKLVGITSNEGSKLIADHFVKKMKIISDKIDSYGLENDGGNNVYLATKIEENLKNDIDALKNTTKISKYTEVNEIFSPVTRHSISENIIFDENLPIATHLDRNYRASYADLSEYMNSSKLAPTLTANLLLSHLQSPIDDSRMAVELGQMVYPSRLINLLLMDMWNQGMIDQATIFLEKCLSIFKSELTHETDTEVVINKGTFLLNNVNRVRIKISNERDRAMQDLSTESKGMERKQYLKMLLIVKRYCDTIFGQMYHFWVQNIIKDLDKKVLHAIAVDDTVFAVQQNAHKYFRYMIQKGARYKMLDLIQVFNSVYLSLKINGFDELITKSVLQDLLTYIDIAAFNKIMKNPHYLSVKKCNLLKSNMSILLEWCKDRHITDAPIRLMHILTLTQILQIKALGLADIDSLMKHTKDLTKAQLCRIIEESDKNDAVASNDKLQKVISNGSSTLSLMTKETDDNERLAEFLLPVHDGMFESMPLKIL